MGNTYEYTGINDSPTLTVTAGAAIKDAPCKAVKFQDGKVILPAAGECPAGILLISSESDIPEGVEAAIQVKDIGLWKAGAAFAAGDMLAADAEGLCQKAAGGQFMYARALDGAAAKGDLVVVQIVNAGYEAQEASSGTGGGN